VIRQLTPARFIKRPSGAGALAVGNLLHCKKMAPIEGAIRLAGSLRSPVMMVVVMMMMVRLCARDRADRERNSGDGSQNEGKVPHKNFSSGWILRA
jgi:hypothetical protein